jgi:hypothetical protein
LNEYCRKKPEKSPPPPSGGGGGGGGGGGPDPDTPRPGPGEAQGDPHLKTFDGVRFDFQQLGEYTLVRSTKDDFVVQVRQVPVPKSRAVSVNQAMATRIGGQRVMVSLEDRAAVLRVDGAVVTGDPPVLKSGSLTTALTSYGVTYVFEWPDGTVVRAEQLGGYTINVRVTPSDARRGTLEGLLGKNDGVANNDVVDPPALAEKWRVPQTESLFEYQPGQSASTFLDPSFPDPSQTVPNREAAERACREEGITDAGLLHDCVIDFGITNGFLFASQYAHQQKVLEARAALAPMTGTSTTAARERLLTMAGAIADKTQSPQFTFEAQAGDVIFLHDPDCVDQTETSSAIYFALFAPDGQIVQPGQRGCQIGRVALPVAGTFTFKGNLGKNEIGKYSIPIRFVRHDRVQAIKYGDIVSGNIDQRAAHDVYTFTAKAGDLVQLAGKGCQLTVFTAIIDSAGHDILGPDCREGNVHKIVKDGTYSLLINSGDGGPGKYQFVFQGVSAKEAPDAKR